MRFTFTVEVECERTEGKFASRDDLAAQIIEELEGANPDSLTGDNDGEYEVTDWSVTEEPQPKRVRRPKLAAAADRARQARDAGGQ